MADHRGGNGDGPVDFCDYVLILAAIGPLALLIRGGMVGASNSRLRYVIALVDDFPASR